MRERVDKLTGADGMSDPVRQYSCLARSCSRKDQKRSFCIKDSLLLRLIQGIIYAHKYKSPVSADKLNFAA